MVIHRTHARTIVLLKQGLNFQQHVLVSTCMASPDGQRPWRWHTGLSGFPFSILSRGFRLRIPAGALKHSTASVLECSAQKTTLHLLKHSSATVSSHETDTVTGYPIVYWALPASRPRNLAFSSQLEITGNHHSTATRNMTIFPMNKSGISGNSIVSRCPKIHRNPPPQLANRLLSECFTSWWEECWKEAQEAQRPIELHEPYLLATASGRKSMWHLEI